MENEKSIFNLELDVIAKNHLKDTAKWARFLAIVGFAGLTLIVISSIIISVNSSVKSQDPFAEHVNGSADIAGSIIGACIILALYFFPCYFLLKFASKMKVAIDTDDSTSLNEALKNLKEQNMLIINQVAQTLPADARGIDLNKRILELILAQDKNALHNIVLDALNFEARKLMK